MVALRRFGEAAVASNGIWRGAVRAAAIYGPGDVGRTARRSHDDDGHRCGGRVWFSDVAGRKKATDSRGRGGSKTRREERRTARLLWELGWPAGERGRNGVRRRGKAEVGSEPCTGPVRGESRWAARGRVGPIGPKFREREKKKIKFLFYFQTISKAFEIILNFGQNHSSQK